MERLTDEQIDARLAASDWSREGDAIVCEVKAQDFAAAVALVNAIAAAAEAANHHPDILIHGWNRVRLALSTHSAGGLTDADFELARKLDGVLADAGVV